MLKSLVTANITYIYMVLLLSPSFLIRSNYFAITAFTEFSVISSILSYDFFKLIGFPVIFSSLSPCFFSILFIFCLLFYYLVV